MADQLVDTLAGETAPQSGIAQEPLLLTIIARMSRNQPLPDRRVRVYDGTAAVTLLLAFIQPAISCERAIEIAEALTWNEADATTERQQVIDMLHELRQRPELSNREKLQIATRLYENSPSGSVEQQEATKMFQALVHQQTSLTFEDVEELYQVSSLHFQMRCMWSCGSWYRILML